MINMKKPIIYRWIWSSVLLAAFADSACASTVFLKNDDTAEVHVTVEGGDGTQHGRKKHVIETKLRPSEEKEVIISKNQFGNIEIYSITGKVKMLSLYNKCFPLAMNTDYKIVFVGGRAGGTICVAQPIAITTTLEKTK